MTLSTTTTARRELDRRQANGIDVTLSWCPAGGALYVTVLDDAGEPFELRVGPEEALDVFNHPFAYAAFRPGTLLGVGA